MFLHTFLPSPILFALGPLTVRWYGFLIGSAIGIGLIISIRTAKKHGIPKNAIIDIAFWSVVWGVIGARLYHVINELPFYIAHPLNIVKIYNGGLAIHGALIAGIIAVWRLARKRGVNFLRLLDVFAPAVILGQAIGRFGNYFNQELFGRPSDLPWSIPIAFENRPIGYESFTHFHPAFLYESVINILIFAILLIIHKYYSLSKDLQQNKDGKTVSSACKDSSAHSLAGKILSKPGTIFALYLLLYSFGRIFTETFRIDNTPHIFGIRLPLLISILCILLSIAVFHRIVSKKESVA